MNKLFFFLFLVIGHSCFSQTKKDYIYEYASVAVAEMEYAKIPASITLAQGILESRFGLSELSVNANNHFGIKCHRGWTGGRTYHDDDAENECFRAYTNAHESFRDHSDFLAKRGRYSDLFKLSLYDYKGWAKGLRKAGYATNPRYADHLIKIIEDEKLYVFDRMTSEEVGPYIASLQNKKGEGEIMWAKADPKPVRVDRPEPVNAVTQKDETIEIIGGPAASPEDEVSQSRDIFIVNDIKTIRTFEGDTKEQIASKYNVSLRRLTKYNEWDLYFDEFQPGMKVYLQPKRSKNRDITEMTHTVQPGETMYQIAQQYGIKTKKLYQRNQLSEALKEQPHPGEIIHLRKSRDTKPKLLNPDEVFTEEKVQVIDDGEGEAIGRPDQNEEETEEFIEKEIVEDGEGDSDVEGNEEQSSPFSDEEYPSASPAKTPETKPVTTDPFSNEEYPSSSPGSSDKDESTVLNPSSSEEEEQQQGRAIIYDETPEVNKQPVEVYEKNDPFTESSPPQSNNSKSKNEISYHKVVKGDTLWGISQKYNVSVQQIKEWNNLSDNNIKLGQRIVVGK